MKIERFEEERGFSLINGGTASSQPPEDPQKGINYKEGSSPTSQADQVDGRYISQISQKFCGSCYLVNHLSYLHSLNTTQLFAQGHIFKDPSTIMPGPSKLRKPQAS